MPANQRSYTAHQFHVAAAHRFFFENPRTDQRQCEAFEVLKMATVNGAHAMELYDADILAKGKLADLIMVDLSNIDKNNIIHDLVFKATQDNVKLTMINGKILYQNGHYFLNEKVEDIYRKVEEISQRIEKDL